MAETSKNPSARVWPGPRPGFWPGLGPWSGPGLGPGSGPGLGPGSGPRAWPRVMVRAWPRVRARAKSSQLSKGLRSAFASCNPITHPFHLVAQLRSYTWHARLAEGLPSQSLLKHKNITYFKYFPHKPSFPGAGEVLMPPEFWPKTSCICGLI